MRMVKLVKERSIGENRLRAEYFSPTKFIIIVSKNKAMYYNIDLDEDEFFDPKIHQLDFFDIFHNPKFFLTVRCSEKMLALPWKKEA